jgi:hypothetical protein
MVPAGIDVHDSDALRHARVGSIIRRSRPGRGKLILGCGRLARPAAR